MVETLYSIPGAPRIALLGDFHNGDPAPILSSIVARNPELICVAGDMVYARAPDEGLAVDDQASVLALLGGCASLAPTFVSLGNHESILAAEDWAKIGETGVEIVDNEWVEWNGIHIGGITSHYVLDARARREAHPSQDPYGRRVDAQEEYDVQPASKPTEESEKLAHIEEPDLSWIAPIPSTYTILLSHHPEYFPRLPQVDLVLSAHAHGGQWRFFDRGLFAPNQGWFPKYTSGVYVKPGFVSRMVVTRGLTNSVRVPRIFNPTEIVYINL